MDPTKPRKKRRKRDFIAPGFVLVAIAVVILAGWWRHTRPKPKPMDEATMKRELQQVVPIGTPFKQAWDAMTARGFECVVVPPNVFAEVQPVICNRKDELPDAKPVQWQVILKNDKKNGTVTELVVVKH